MRFAYLYAIVLAMAFVNPAKASVVVFDENFDNTTGGNISLVAGTDPDWKVAHSNGTSYDNTSTANTPVVSNAASSTGAAPTGYLFHNTFQGNAPVIYYVEGLSLGAPAGGTVLESVSFALRNVSTSENIQIALKFGPDDDDWFLGDTTFNNATSSVWSNLSLTLSNETWKALTLDVGNAISVGSAATPASFNTADLTGIGFYTATTSDPNYIRIDTLAVNAIPEPASLALMGLGSLLILGRRRVA